MSANRWISDLYWRREGKQSRSEKTQNALLDATEELLLERGVGGISIEDIAKKAGSSIGSVYHHFKDKRALFHAVFHRVANEFVAVNQSASDPSRWEGASIMDILEGFIVFSLQPDKKGPSVRAAALVVAYTHPDLRRHFAEIQADMYKCLMALLMARQSEVGHPDPERAIAFALDQLGAVLRARIDTIQKSAMLTQTSDKIFTQDALSSISFFLCLDDRKQD